MSLRLGGVNITALRLGATAITSLRLGSTVLWSATQIRDDFAGDGALSASWVLDQKSSVYEIASVGGQARINIPDGFLDVSWFRQWSRHRHIVQHPADGWLETVVANKGTPGYDTIVYRRFANSGSASGVGVRFLSSHLDIMKRVGTTDTVMQDCGEFSVGDNVRLVQVGNLHTVYRNGQFAGEWNDTTGSVPNTAAQRSMAMHMSGEKPVFSPRGLSPGLDYVECG